MYIVFPWYRYENSVTKAWLNTHKQRVREDELFMRIQPDLSGGVIISWILYIIYMF